MSPLDRIMNIDDVDDKSNIIYDTDSDKKQR